MCGNGSIQSYPVNQQLMILTLFILFFLVQLICYQFMFFVKLLNNLEQKLSIMSVFENLNINQTIELGPTVILHPSLKNKIHCKTIRSNHRVSKSQLISPSQNNQQKHITPVQYQQNILISPPLQQTSKTKKFNSCYFKKINENKVKIESLAKQSSISKFNKSKNSSTLNLNEIQIKQTLNQLTQEIVEQIQQNLILIPKRSNKRYKNASQFKQSSIETKFQSVLKGQIQRLNSPKNNSQITTQTSNTNQTSSEDLIIWKIKTQQLYFTFETISNQFTKFVNDHYPTLFSNQQQGIPFLKFLAQSEQIEAYQINRQILINFSIQSIDQLCFIFNKDQNQMSQKYLLQLIQKRFLEFFTTPDQKQNNVSKKKKKVSPINNYEFYEQPTNLSVYLPSYEQEAHFLLDKFGENESIFDDEQKLTLLLNVSRDPYNPRSSVKCLSHISTFVQSIFGLKQQDSDQEIKQSSSQKQLRQQQDKQVEQQLKSWQQTFGQMLLKF